MTKEQEAEVIKRGFLFYWSCEICKKLKWDSKCQDKNKCGERIYNLLLWHFNKKN